MPPAIIILPVHNHNPYISTTCHGCSATQAMQVLFHINYAPARRVHIPRKCNYSLGFLTHALALSNLVLPNAQGPVLTKCCIWSRNPILRHGRLLLLCSGSSETHSTYLAPTLVDDCQCCSDDQSYQQAPSWNPIGHRQPQHMHHQCLEPFQWPNLLIGSRFWNFDQHYISILHTLKSLLTQVYSEEEQYFSVVLIVGLFLTPENTHPNINRYIYKCTGE